MEVYKIKLRELLLVASFILLFSCVNVAEASPDSAAQQQGSSSAAFNSDGKGVVMVSCNGKTYSGEGMAACTSTASTRGTGAFFAEYVGLLCLSIVISKLWFFE